MDTNLPKVAIIGSGNVGSNAALFTALDQTAAVTLIDIVEGLAEGRALDISQALAILGVDTPVAGSDDFAAIAKARVVVITAGLPRAPGMSRTDLLQKNAAIVKLTAAQIKQRAPDAIVIVVTNPLDVLTHLTHSQLGGDSARVMGMGGLLDSGRFTHFLSEASGIARSSIESIVVGAHGDEMVPVTSRAGARGVLMKTLIGTGPLDRAAAAARHGGAQIIGLLKTGSAAYGPGAAISLMVRSILRDEKRVFSACVEAGGAYGHEGIYMNLPAVLGAGGVETVMEIELSPEERGGLDRSAEAIRGMLKELESI